MDLTALAPVRGHLDRMPPTSPSLASLEPGRSFVPVLSVEQEQILLNLLRQHQGRVLPTQMAHALEMTVAAARPLFVQLCEKGEVRSVYHNNKRAYELISLIDPPQGVVQHVARPVIHDFLMGRREMARAIARHIGLSVEDVRATCLVMVEAGELDHAQVQSAMIYGPAQGPRPPSLLDVEPAEAVPPAEPVVVPPKVTVTPELEHKLREALPAGRRRKGTDMARVAEEYGLSVGQVRRALARIPTS